MKVSLLEPIGISKEQINAFAKGIEERGGVFTYYDTKTTDIE